jgi:hypothetical protein
MSGAREVAREAEGYIEELLADMFEDKADSNCVLLGSLGEGKDLVQVQLIVTRNPSDFFDD